MGNISFEEALENIKALGETERRTIEIAHELAKIIGSLADARVKSGLTQRQLAEKSGIKQSAIARMESLRAVPRLDTVISVARALNSKIKIDTPYTLKTNGEVISLQSVRNNAGNKYLWAADSSKPKTEYSFKEATYAALG